MHIIDTRPYQCEQDVLWLLSLIVNPPHVFPRPCTATPAPKGVAPIDEFMVANLSQAEPCPDGWERWEPSVSERYIDQLTSGQKERTVHVNLWRNAGFCIHRTKRKSNESSPSPLCTLDAIKNGCTSWADGNSAIAREAANKESDTAFYRGAGIRPLTDIHMNITEENGDRANQNQDRVVIKTEAVIGIRAFPVPLETPDIGETKDGASVFGSDVSVAGKPSSTSSSPSSSDAGDDGASAVNIRPIVGIKLYKRYMRPWSVSAPKQSPLGDVTKHRGHPCEDVHLFPKALSWKDHLKNQPECHLETNVVPLDNVRGSRLVDWDFTRLESSSDGGDGGPPGGRVQCAMSYFYGDDPLACARSDSGSFNIFAHYWRGPHKAKGLELQWYLGVVKERDWQADCPINRTKLLQSIDDLKNMEIAEWNAFIVGNIFFGVVLFQFLCLMYHYCKSGCKDLDEAFDDREGVDAVLNALLVVPSVALIVTQCLCIVEAEYAWEEEHLAIFGVEGVAKRCTSDEGLQSAFESLKLNLLRNQVDAYSMALFIGAVITTVLSIKDAYYAVCGFIDHRCLLFYPDRMDPPLWPADPTKPQEPPRWENETVTTATVEELQAELDRRANLRMEMKRCLKDYEERLMEYSIRNKFAYVLFSERQLADHMEHRKRNHITDVYKFCFGRCDAYDDSLQEDPKQDATQEWKLCSNCKPLAPNIDDLYEKQTKEFKGTTVDGCCSHLLNAETAETKAEKKDKETESAEERAYNALAQAIIDTETWGEIFDTTPELKTALQARTSEDGRLRKEASSHLANIASNACCHLGINFLCGTDTEIKKKQYEVLEDPKVIWGAFQRYAGGAVEPRASTIWWQLQNDRTSWA